MQLLFERGDEGGAQGLGWIPGTVPQLGASITPHMGWNSIRPRQAHPLLGDAADPDLAYYFVHSYYVHPIDDSVVVGETEYGQWFPSLVVQGSVVGAQFHPELSGSAGRRFIQRYIQMVVR
jgi:glutamine amidotransferase